MATTHKRLLILVLGALAGMLVAASAAYACASLATLKLEQDSAAAGSTVEGRGDAFRDSADGFTPVTISLENRDGEVLWTGTPENRTVHFSFDLPSDVEPGIYALVGTQSFSDGTPAAGTPARTTIEITPAAGAAAAMTPQTETSPAVAPAPAEQAPAAAEEPSTFTATQPATANAVEAAPAPAPAAVPAEPTAPAPQPAAASSAPTAAVAPVAQESAPAWQAAETAAFPAAARASSAGVTLTKAAETAAFPTALRASDSSATAAAAPVAQPSSAITAMQAAMSTTAAAWLLAAVVGLALGVLLVSRRRQVAGLA